MLLKHMDDRLPALLELEALLQTGRIPQHKVDTLERTVRLAQAAIRTACESARVLDALARDSTDAAIMHDLRLALPDGRVAQIDHLYLDYTGRFHILDTRHFAHGLKIAEDGAFLRWNARSKRYEAVPSPIEQTARQAQVLAEVVKSLGLPAPVIRSLILVSDKARVQHADGVDTSMVVKASEVIAALQRGMQGTSAPDSDGDLVPSALTGQWVALAKRLVALHRPAKVDYLAAMGITLLPERGQRPKPPASAAVAGSAAPDAVDAAVTAAAAAAAAAAAVAKATVPKTGTPVACKTCAGTDLTIHAGRYGYYFRCRPCGLNTAISMDCGTPGHNERLRRAGPDFFRECAACGSSSLYFRNPVG